MGVILHILTIVACIAMTYGTISELSEHHVPVNPYTKVIPVKLVNAEIKVDVSVHESSNENEVFMYPEKVPKKNFFKRHHACGSDLGVKFSKTKFYFCKLNYVSLKIEDFDFYHITDYSKYPTEIPFERERRKILLVTVFFQSKINELTLKIPVHRIPARISSSSNSQETLNWARLYDVGLLHPTDPSKFDEIKNSKKFKLDFTWLKNLLTRGVYPNQLLRSEDDMPEGNIFFTRSFALPESLLEQYVGLIN